MIGTGFFIYPDVLFCYAEIGQIPELQGLLGGWNQMIFKIPSNPYHSMIL